VIKSSRIIRKPANTNQIIFFSGEKNINQVQKTNSQNSRYLCTGPKNVSIVLHTQDWLKANLVNYLVKENVASQLTRLQTFILLHMEHS
jgi:hypothetical protein